MLDEAPEGIGIEIELDGIAPDGASGISGVVNVSSAFGIRISLDKSCSLALHGLDWYPEHG